MKYLKNTYKLTFTVSIVLMMLLSVSCSANNAEPTGNYAPANDKYPSYDFTEAVAKISSQATELTIKSYRTGNMTTLDKDRPEFTAIIDYIKRAKLIRHQSRFVENEGETVEATILYSLSYFLNFKLSDDSVVVFDYGGDIWFNSKDMIYGASADDAMFELVQRLSGDDE